MDGFLAELRRRADRRDVPVLVVTSQGLTDDDRRHLNGEVERIIHTGADARAELLLLAACVECRTDSDIERTA